MVICAISFRVSCVFPLWFLLGCNDVPHFEVVRLQPIESKGSTWWTLTDADKGYSMVITKHCLTLLLKEHYFCFLHLL
jgi:hypothetical protein